MGSSLPELRVGSGIDVQSTAEFSQALVMFVEMDSNSHIVRTKLLS